MSQMIDWNTAVQTGIRLVRSGPTVSPEAAYQIVAELRELSGQAQGHVRDFTGMDGALDPSPAVVVDRPDWIRANVDGFKVVLEPLMEQLSAKRGGGLLGGGPAAQAARPRAPRLPGGRAPAVTAPQAPRRVEPVLPA